MIHPDRPLVIYQSMSIDLDSLDVKQPVLRGDYNKLEVNGKRGSVELAFHLEDNGEVVGRGKKHMLVTGLRAYDEGVARDAVSTYNDSKMAFSAP